MKDLLALTPVTGLLKSFPLLMHHLKMTEVEGDEYEILSKLSRVNLLH